MTAMEYFEKGVEYVKQANYEEALQCFDKSIKLDENYARTWQGKGNACINLKDYETALKCYNKAVELDRNYAPAWYGKGSVYCDLRDYKTALKYYNKAIELDEEFAASWHSKGVVYSHLEDYEAALDCYDKAIAFDGNSILAWNSKGNTYFHLENYEAALDCYDKAIALDGNSAILWYGKGNAYCDLKYYKAALDCYDKAIALDRSSAAFWLGKGNVYRHSKDYEAALDCYNNAIKLDKSSAIFRYSKGNIYNALKDYDAALDCFDEAIELDAKLAEPWHGKGNVYLNTSDTTLSQRVRYAQIHYKRALVLGWSLPFLLHYLKTWQSFPEHPFFLQDIFQKIPISENLPIKQQVTSMCQYINLWQDYLDTTEKYNQLSPLQNTQFQALINYLMGHPSKAFNILKDEVIPRDSDNLQAYYYLIMSCYEFLENKKPYLEIALEIAKKYQKSPSNSNQNAIIQRYYVAHLFWINKDIDAAIECLQPVWKSANFLPTAYFYLELNYRKKQYATFDSDEEISDEIYWTDEDISILKEEHLEEIGDFIMEAEGDENTKYTFSYGFPVHNIKPHAEEWWQPVYHYAHYREITNAIDLLQFQAKHVFETDVKGSQDLKDFWNCFKIDEKDIITMSEEIRKVGLQKVGQAFLNRAEVHVKDMVGKVDKSEAELKEAIYQVVYGRGDTKEQTKQTFEHLETTLEKAGDIEDALVHRIASKIEAEELGSDTETYLYLISYFLLLQELTPKESIYLQFYVLYADAFRSGGISKVVQGGLKDVVKTLTGEGFDMAMDVLAASNPVTGLAKATLKPFVKGSMGEFFIAFLKGVQQKTMMKYSISQGIKDGYPIPSFKESFLEFVGKEKERLGQQFDQTYPLYGYEDWLEA